MLLPPLRRSNKIHRGIGRLSAILNPTHRPLDWLLAGILSAHRSLMVLVVKNLPVHAGDPRDKFNPWVRKIPWSRKRHSIPVFLPGELRGQRSQGRHSSRGPEELDRTEGLSTQPVVTRQVRQPLEKPCTPRGDRRPHPLPGPLSMTGR